MRVCQCGISRTTPMDEEDARKQNMSSVVTPNGFFRMCTLCNFPLYLRHGLGPYDKDERRNERNKFRHKP